MRRYLLDANIIMKLWSENEDILMGLLKEDKVRVLNEVLNELSIKEIRLYRRKEVLSERFCMLLKYAINVDEDNLSGFYTIYDYEIKNKFEKNNLSQNDIMQIYCSYIDKELVLVTDDKQLYEIAKSILGNRNVLNSKELYEEIQRELI